MGDGHGLPAHRHGDGRFLVPPHGLVPGRSHGNDMGARAVHLRLRGDGGNLARHDGPQVHHGRRRRRGGVLLHVLRDGVREDMNMPGTVLDAEGGGAMDDLNQNSIKKTVTEQYKFGMGIYSFMAVLI